jgi:hypothetical protein
MSHAATIIRSVATRSCALAVLLPWAAVTHALEAGSIEPAVTNRISDLFTMRNGLACHTSTYAPRRLVWTSSTALHDVRAVYPQPEAAATVYGVADGAMHRSDDFAITWRRLPLATAVSSDAITDVAFRPGEPETFCFATRAAGVWISRDGGQTARQIGSRATGLAADAVTSLIYAPGDILRRTLLAAHGSAALGISRGDTRTGAWTVAAPDYAVFRMIPVTPQGRDLCLFASAKSAPEAMGVYYASVLGAYWQRIVADVAPTDGAWFAPQQAFYVTTGDTGILKLASGASTLQDLGGNGQAWSAAGMTWNAHADAPVAYLYEPAERGLIWTTNDLTVAVSQSQGLYRGAFVREGAQVRANAGGTRFYGAINGVLWIGCNGNPLRVDTAAITPAAVNVAPGAMRGDYWRAADDALRSFAEAPRAAGLAERLTRMVAERNSAIPDGPVTVEARITAPAGMVPAVSVDLSRFGLSPVTPLAIVSNGVYAASFNLTPETLVAAAERRAADWRPSFPGPLPVTVSARVPGHAPVSGVATLALYPGPEAAAFGRDSWALYAGDVVGKVTLTSERTNPDEYWVPLHQRLVVGPGAWRVTIWHMAQRASMSDYEAMTFLLRSAGPAGGDILVQLCDKPEDAISTTTPGVALVAGGYIAGGSVTTAYRRVTIPLTDLLRGSKTFNPEQFGGVAFSGTNTAACTYLIDDWRFVVSTQDIAPEKESKP